MPTVKLEPIYTGDECQYCKMDSLIIVTGDDVFRNPFNRADNKYYVCLQCNARVGTHRVSGAPLGSVANKKLANQRRLVHEAFDTIWRHTNVKRTAAYQWLADSMGLDKEHCHIGMFDEAQCEEALGYIDGRRSGFKPVKVKR